MTTINQAFWGSIPESYIKTLTITRTKPTDTVEFYSQAVTKYQDHEVTKTLAYQTAMSYLESIKGGVYVYRTVNGLSQVTEIVIDTFNTAVPAVMMNFENAHVGVIDDINNWNQQQGITTEMSIS